MFKMISSRGRLTKTARDASKGAYIAGSDGAFIIFPDAYENTRKFKRVTDLLESIGVSWCDLDGDIFASSHWVFEAISERSERALAELKSLIS